MTGPNICDFISEHCSVNSNFLQSMSIKRQRKTRDEDKILVKRNRYWRSGGRDPTAAWRERKGERGSHLGVSTPLPSPSHQKYCEEPTWCSPFTLPALLTIGGRSHLRLSTHIPNPPTRNWQVVSSAVGHPHVCAQEYLYSIQWEINFQQITWQSEWFQRRTPREY